MRPAWVGYAVAAVVMGVLDAAWIGLVASDLYRDQLGDVVTETPRWLPALGFYVLFWAGLCRLVIGPAVAQGLAVVQVAGQAALLGLVAYGTWALTGLAVLAPMTWTVALSDLVWGPVMSLVTATAAVQVARRVGARGSGAA